MKKLILGALLAAVLLVAPKHSALACNTKYCSPSPVVGHVSYIPAQPAFTPQQMPWPPTSISVPIMFSGQFCRLVFISPKGVYPPVIVTLCF